MAHINDVNGVMYRCSQYEDLQEATDQGGVVHLEEVYGDGAAYDMINNMCKVARMLDQDSPNIDIKIILIFDGHAQRECFLNDAWNVINEYIGEV